MQMGLPLRVQGHTPDGTPWVEMSMTEDAYWGGAGFILRHTVVLGNALQLSLPLPKQFRRYDLTTASYTVYALVRHATALQDGTYRVGVMFLGKLPPRGHDKVPGGRFLLPTDAAAEKSAKERRFGKRFDLAVNMELRTLAEGDDRREYTVTRNVGPGGLEVLTSLGLAVGTGVLLGEVGGPFQARGEVRHIHIGKDNIPRLNIHFLDDDAEDAVQGLLKRNGLLS